MITIKYYAPGCLLGTKNIVQYELNYKKPFMAYAFRLSKKSFVDSY